MILSNFHTHTKFCDGINTPKEMVEKANGDPDYFRAIYKNEVADSARTISADIERAGGLINYLQNLK